MDAALAHRPPTLRSALTAALRGIRARGHRPRSEAAVGTAARRRRDGAADAGRDVVRVFRTWAVTLQRGRHAGGAPDQSNPVVSSAGGQDRGQRRTELDMTEQEQHAIMTLVLMAAFADGRNDETERAEVNRITAS